MRKIILSLALLTALFSSCGADNVCHVKGKLNNVEDTLYMYVTSSKRDHPDTVLVKKGEFEVDIPLKESSMVLLAHKLTSAPNGYDLLHFIAVPGESLQITGDMSDGKFSGSRFYDEYNAARQELKSLMAPLNMLEKEVADRMKKGEDKATIMKDVNPRYVQFQQKMVDGIKSYVKNHKSSEGASALLVYLMPEDVAPLWKSLDANVRNGKTKAVVEEVMKDYEEMKKRDAASNQSVARDFKLNDIHGNALSLSSLRGKYVVLDFWGSWCPWCIKGMPAMKEYYNKYKGKFEILGIDCNDPVEKWKDAVQKHQLPWKHVRDEKGEVVSMYGVQGFPTKFLIDPEGKIVLKITGEDPNFYKELDKLFGEK